MMSARGPALSLSIVRAADSGRSRKTIHGDLERVEYMVRYNHPSRYFLHSRAFYHHRLQLLVRHGSRQD
jgi:hypothetical protein